MGAALILTGAPGSGKTSVLDALGTLLEIDRVTHGAVDSDELARGWPWMALPSWLPQLAAVVALQRDAGRDLFLVAVTTETARELLAVVEAVAADRVLVVCLRASAHTVAQRVAEREPDAWPGKRSLVAHARELAPVIPAIAGIDVVIDTDRQAAAAVADEIHQLLRERGVIAAGEVDRTG